MLRKSLIGMAVLALFFPPGALAQTKQAGINPADAVETADPEFPLDEGLFSLAIIRECLQSFRKLTEEAQGKIPKPRLKEIGNTDWDMQEIGFSNNPAILEGTLRRQDYRIRQLQYELVKRRVKEGSAAEKELQEARHALEASRQTFQDFRKNFRRKD